MFNILNQHLSGLICKQTTKWQGKHDHTKRYSDTDSFSSSLHITVYSIIIEC